MAETRKAFERRVRERFFEYYVRVPVIDIGCGSKPADPLTDSCRKYDIALGDGDATYMKDVPDKEFNTVYSSHCLEHLDNPEIAVGNWARILNTGGNLIIVVPHLLLYEKQVRLPSRWNGDHKTYWLPNLAWSDENVPHWRGLYDVCLPTMLRYGMDLISLRVLDFGHTITDPDKHSDGEYSIEVILRKRN